MIDEGGLLHMHLQDVHMIDKGMAVGGKPLCGLCDRTLHDLHTAQEIHDLPDPADRQTHLVVQDLECGV